MMMGSVANTKSCGLLTRDVPKRIGVQHMQDMEAKEQRKAGPRHFSFAENAVEHVLYDRDSDN